MKKKESDFMFKFTFAQATALAMVLKQADVPRELWGDLAGVFAKSFQLALTGKLNNDKDKS